MEGGEYGEYERMGVEDGEWRGRIVWEVWRKSRE